MSHKEKAQNKQMTVGEFATALLKGTAKASDDSLTFACLDSFYADKPETRKRYFPVYRVISSQSDGALGELICGYVKAYFHDYPVEAIENYSLLSNKEQQKFIDDVAFEFYASGTDYKADLDEYFREIRVNCKACSPKSFNTIAEIKAKIITAVSKIQD